MSTSDGGDREDRSLQARLRDLLARHVDRGSLPAAASRLATTEREAAEVRSWLESLGVDAAMAAAASHPTAIGPYRILDVLGQGGMGVVYLAEQQEPVKRRVAIKLVKLGMDTRAVVARFEHERQALALMQHDGIAKVYDCGTTERGQPYFVMEVVEGVPLHRYCEQHRLPVRDRIALLQQVCAAVTHAHQKGVVHRDLKPGNVLVHEAGGKPQVKVIDFGLAKAIGEKLVEASLFTEAGRVVGTPEYMAPEQADPTNRDVDTRADVYSLGVMLYELLVGSLPFETAELRRGGIDGVLRVLREQEPARPSLRLSSDRDSATAIAAMRRTSTTALRRTLRNDLDWVVLKAIEKDRNRRYDSARTLADELQRYLDDVPVVAGPPGAGYRLRKLLVRQRVPLGTAAVLLLTLFAGGIATYRQFCRAEARTREFELLSAVVLYENAATEEALLHPPWPDKAAEMANWLSDRADRLLAMVPPIEATVTESAQRISDARSASAPVDVADQFLHDTLAAVLPKLESLREPRSKVAQDLGWARQIGELTRHHPGARHSWSEVRAAIAANPLYAGRRLDLDERDVMGLVPIGENPMTHLWEFYDLRSAWDGEVAPAGLPIPVLEADGSVDVGDETGIVFVLLPGGRFRMGSAQLEVAPPNEVVLEPFLLARHELTRGQWLRLWTQGGAMARPGVYAVGAADPAGAMVTWRHPVDSVDWTSCDMLLRRHGMVLPTEAQWEYAARAGTDSAWWIGDAAGELAYVANLADNALVPLAAGVATESIDDGFALVAPVGMFAANAFGLFDVHGNVAEWCLDEYAYYDSPVRDADGYRLRPSETHNRVNRGGCWLQRADAARSAARVGNPAATRVGTLGLRAARSLRPNEAVSGSLR